jgi:hypothetical protein
MSTLWVLGGLVVVVLLIAALGVRLGAHPARGHCGPMCGLGQRAGAPTDAAAPSLRSAPGPGDDGSAGG